MGSGLGRALSTLTSAPWRRAPILLRGRPGVLVTVAAACAVMTTSLAAVPLFLSSVGTESVALQASERCPRDTGISLHFVPTASALTSPPADPFTPLRDHLGPTNRWARIDGALAAGADPTIVERASLLTRDGAHDHVEVLETTPGQGLWVSDRATELLGLHAGDVARIGDRDVRVTGVYRDLSGNTADDFWCSNADMVLIEARSGDLVPPPLLFLADTETFASLVGDFEEPDIDGAWDAPLGDGLTTSEADALVAELACGARDGEQLRWCTEGQPLLPRARTRSGGTSVAARDDADFVERYLHSHLPFVTERSQAIRTSVGGAIWPIAGFGALAGAGLVAASASLWFDRRQRAVTLLSVRGVSPAGLGLKAVLELSIPLAVGVAVGVVAAHAMVTALGPSPVLEPSALRDAAGLGVMALVGASLTIGAVVAWRSRPHARHAARRRWFAALPWELLLAWLTVVSYRRLGDWGVPIGRGAEVSHVDLLGLMFPVLFLVTVVAVTSRLLSWTARPLRAASRRWPTALYLGVRRVTRYRVAILGLLAASSIAAGVLGYAATMSRSLDATLEAKAKTYVGSDVAVRLDADEALPTEIQDRSTEVDLHRFANIGPEDRDAAVIAIDTDTFERAAFWDPGFADPSLDTILEALDGPTGDAGVPAVVVGTDVPPGSEVAVLDQGTRRFTIDPIAGVRTFPGMRLPKPTVFVRQDAIADLNLVAGRREVWIAGDREATLEALERAGLGYVEDRQVGEVVDGASFRTVTWTFGFMQSLGASAGLLALGGVIVYLDARRRDRLLGYAFMRRMGLRRAQHRRALAVELVASVLVGTLLGMASALTAAWLAHDRVDPVPKFQPDPLLLPALPVIVGLTALSLAVVLVASALAQRRVDRDDPVEVLRAGT